MDFVSYLIIVCVMAVVVGLVLMLPCMLGEYLADKFGIDLGELAMKFFSDNNNE